MNVYKELLSCTPKNCFRVCQKQPSDPVFSHVRISVSDGKRKCINSSLRKDLVCMCVKKKKIDQKVPEQSKPVREITE